MVLQKFYPGDRVLCQPDTWKYKRPGTVCGTVMWPLSRGITIINYHILQDGDDRAVEVFGGRVWPEEQ